MACVCMLRATVIVYEYLAYWIGNPLQVIYDKITGRSRGFAFVTMSTVEEVEAAVQQFNGYVSFIVLYILEICLLPFLL